MVLTLHESQPGSIILQTEHDGSSEHLRLSELTLQAPNARCLCVLQMDDQDLFLVFLRRERRLAGLKKDEAAVQKTW